MEWTFRLRWPTRDDGVIAQSDLDLSFAALVAEHHADLIRLAYAMVGDADLADDVAQSAWASAWRRRDSLRDRGKVRGWLFAITANEARRALRGRRLKQTLLLGAHEPLTRDRDADAELDLIATLQRLPLRDRELLARRFALGQTSAEIGEELGMSDSGVRVRISRLLAALRRELAR